MPKFQSSAVEHAYDQERCAGVPGRGAAQPWPQPQDLGLQRMVPPPPAWRPAVTCQHWFPYTTPLCLLPRCRQAFLAHRDVQAGNCLALFGVTCLLLRLALSGRASGSPSEPALLLGEIGTIACCLAPPLLCRVAGRRRYAR